MFSYDHEFLKPEYLERVFDATFLTDALKFVQIWSLKKKEENFGVLYSKPEKIGKEVTIGKPWKIGRNEVKR